MNLDVTQAALSRYGFSMARLSQNESEIRTKLNLAIMRRYYVFIPLGLGLSIVLLGYLAKFEFLLICSAPFLLYAIYGIFRSRFYSKLKSSNLKFSMNSIELNNHKNKLVIQFETIDHLAISTQLLDKNKFIGIVEVKNLDQKSIPLLHLVSGNEDQLKQDLHEILVFFEAQINK